jgi:hypothetical protein
MRWSEISRLLTGVLLSSRYQMIAKKSKELKGEIKGLRAYLAINSGD